MAEIKKTYTLSSNRKLDSPDRIDDDPTTWDNHRVYKREGGVYYIVEDNSWNRVAWVTEEMMLAADELEKQNTALQDTDSMPLSLLEQSELGLLKDPQVSEPDADQDKDPDKQTEDKSSERKR